MAQQPIPPFLPVSALSADLDAFVSVGAASLAGFADARATFECTLAHPRGGREETATGFMVLAGVEPLVDALERFKLKTDELGWLEPLGILDTGAFERLRTMRFACDVDGPPEGTVVFPGEPILSIEGPFWQAQLVAALVKGALATSTTFASRAARLALAAGSAEIIEGYSASLHRLGGNALAGRAAFIGGVAATTNALAARRYRIPIRTSMPQNLVLGAPDAERAITALSKTMRDRPCLRLDPRSPLTSLAIIVASLKKRGAAHFGKNDIALEIASGDRIELARAATEAFRAAGLPEPTLVCSGDLDERRIAELVQRKARYSGFLLREPFGDEELSAHYDLVAVERDGQWAPRIRVGESATDTSDPGRKVIVRYADRSGAPVCDVAHATKERFLPSADIRFVERHSALPTRLAAQAMTPLFSPIMRAGLRVQAAEPARVIRERALKNVKALADRYRRAGCEAYPYGLTPTLAEMKTSLLEQARGV
ncbi:MAG: hypothetical protein IPG50_22815 [Myxococcales bacterium]|nr:hypothetical protein [Myxococcales bacterium]